MLNECAQLPFLGTTDRTVVVRENASNTIHALPGSTLVVKEHQPSRTAKQKDSKEARMIDIELPNYPYSRTLLYEQIKNQDMRRLDSPSHLNAFVGPETFLRFMKSFWYLFSSKAAICERDIIRLNKVLSTLNKTRQDCEHMQEHINQLRERCLISERDAALSLQEVIHKSMIVEKIRAKYALPGSLPGYVHREEKDLANLPDEERKLLMSGTETNFMSLSSATMDCAHVSDATDEYEENFKRMKEESVISRQVKMQEEYNECLAEVDKWRERLVNKRKEVDFWMSKVDKSCVERIRAFQTPPVLIGQIMEMSTALHCCRSSVR